jgi:7-cyano-7-deazaguanine synthase
MVDRSKAVVLLSGGLDSATVLAIANRVNGFKPVCVSFDYGQRHSVELAAAALVANHYDAETYVQDIDVENFAGASGLLHGAVPRDRADEEMSGGIAPTYVPARNTILLAYALGYCEHVGARDLFIGVNALDYSGYPDCRPEYVEAFGRMARLAGSWVDEPGSPFKVHAPLVNKTKAQIIQLGTDLGVPYELTHSCYAPVDGLACGHCDSCIIRRDGFAAAGVPDPTRYLPAESSV